jgi:hypothetical protein
VPEPATVDNLLATREETSTILRISRRQVDYLLAAGKLESINIGRSRRVLVSSIHSFIDRQRGAA